MAMPTPRCGKLVSQDTAATTPMATITLAGSSAVCASR